MRVMALYTCCRNDIPHLARQRNSLPWRLTIEEVERHGWRVLNGVARAALAAHDVYEQDILAPASLPTISLTSPCVPASRRF